ncbi:hypothetical protein K1T71_006885 [Dendrolimus kikuchii]|uniref:Uncharacterized protein n=1 Tax=Dendrolimus kikuchii TaxID=765133 RepID=A0ACC1D3N6_9NEOP|nr:hypothetical protein K1T71_006885 [Dendrolimus kikuchii]
MFRILIPLALILATDARRVQERSPLLRLRYPVTAASKSQIKYAEENNYDETGPGAKIPDYAYKTYKTLEDALVAYLNDPDTKLPEYDQSVALSRLTNKQPQKQQTLELKPEPIQRHYPKTVEEYTGYKNPEGHKYEYVFPQRVYSQDQKKFYDYKPEVDFVLKPKNKKPLEPFKLQKVIPVKEHPISLAHYTRDPDIEEAFDQFNPNPKYSFSYGVHNKETGDLKTAQETREGGIVHGYYSFMDADGKQRIVHYTADDKQGFRATVQRTAGEGYNQ